LWCLYCLDQATKLRRFSHVFTKGQQMDPLPCQTNPVHVLSFYLNPNCYLRFINGLFSSGVQVNFRVHRCIHLHQTEISYIKQK
jgi:hypothetical protein